jgi:hypothetical protein
MVGSVLDRLGPSGEALEHEQGHLAASLKGEGV